MKGFKKTVLSKGVQIWIKVLENAIGGFRLVTTGLDDGAVLSPGTPVVYDEATRTAKVVKMAVLYANAANNATVYQVKKGHLFKTGENMSVQIGGTAYGISSIDTSNADYDAVTLATTLGIALTAGQGLFQSTASGSTASTLGTGTGKGLLYEEVTVEKDVDIAVTLRGTVYARRVPGLANNTLRAQIPLIIFSESF